MESARGRLYHLAGINSRGRIGDYWIVAPTEWNFHASGSYVAGVLGTKVGRGEPARLAPTHLAVLFDPCVGFELRLREHADA